MLQRFRSFLTAVVRQRRLEREMGEEWRHHIDARADDLVASGLDRAASLRQARREFGDPLRWREESREARGLGWLRDVSADARYAVRQWRQAPVFTLTAIITIALGIGASTAIFSVVDAVVLRRLPFVASDQLVMVNRAPGGDPSRLQSSAAVVEFRQWKMNQDTFAELAAISSAVATLKEGNNPAEDLRVTYVSTNLLDMLGVGPRIGRTFDEDDEVLSRGTVALISDGFWKTYFGGVPEVLGRRISIDGMPREIIGVMPAGTSYPLFADRTTALTQVWLPLLTEGWSSSVPGSPSAVNVIGRLNPGISPQLAASRMEQQFPMPAGRQSAYQEGYRAGAAAAMAEAFGGAARGVTVEERPLTMAALPVVDHLVGARTRSWMWLLLGAVLLVLLIACANVAGLLLARTTARQHEIGVRAAIGASRLRIVRQLLVESLVLSGTGAILGLALAWSGIEGLTAALPASIPRTTEISLDMRVLGVAVAASLATGLLFGLLPAWQGSRADVTRTLGDGARTITGHPTHGRLRSALVTLELALTVVLLVGAGLFVTSFMKLMRVDLGFEPERVLTARVAVVQRPSPTGRTVSPLDFVNRLRVIPGVEAAALVAGTGFPLQMSYAPILIMGSDPTTAPRAYLRSYVTADYHRVFKSSLLEGRYFEDEDIYWQRPVALLSEEAARTLFPDGKAAGQELEIEGPSPRTVVGVVRDVRAFSDRGTAGRLVYLPIPSDHETRGHVVIRTSGDPIALVPAVRFAAQEVLGDVPLRDVRPMTSIVSGWDAERRLTMLLLAGFGGLGLVIAVIGVYGLVAYVAAQRTHEVGVRIALGATRGQIVTMFVRSALWITVVGLAIGTVVAWWFSSAATAFLFELEPTDPRIFAMAIATLAAAAIIAAVIPARRAATIDPVTALRQ